VLNTGDTLLCGLKSDGGTLANGTVFAVTYTARLPRRLCATCRRVLRRDGYIWPAAGAASSIASRRDVRKRAVTQRPAKRSCGGKPTSCDAAAPGGGRGMNFGLHDVLRNSLQRERMRSKINGKTEVSI
jgi:hypothetical protein